MTSRDGIFQMVAARRLQWDNLVWQAPVLSLTAEAFLFTIALGHDSSRVARLIASGLSVVVALLSMTLMRRHRQNERHATQWMINYQRLHWPDDEPVDGAQYLAERDATDVAGGWTEKVVPHWPGYKTWIAGLGTFGLAGAFVFAVSCTSWGLLDG